MAEGLTRSEKFVSELCKRAFLKLWTHPNPKGKSDKELTDCLVVCGDHVIIISVKENEYKYTGDSTGENRWEKNAINKSVSQIYGAQRWIEGVDKIERADGRFIYLPPKENRKYHRIAVALGSKGEISLKWGDFGKGFIHLCDEYSINALFNLLDTITDFTQYLVASETFAREGKLIHTTSPEDMIAFYLLNGYSFEIDESEHGKPDALILGDDLWKNFFGSEDHLKMKESFKESYKWDRLIEEFAHDTLTDGMFDMHSKEISKDESALVAMASEPRGHRANLAESFMELFEGEGVKIKSRAVQGRSGFGYVFLIGSSEERESRAKELALRSFVARKKLPDAHTIIGIATDRPGTSKIGYSSDIAYIHIPEWTHELEDKITRMQDELGYFQGECKLKNNEK